jgi:hypothetical protein
MRRREVLAEGRGGEGKSLEGVGGACSRSAAVVHPTLLLDFELKQQTASEEWTQTTRSLSLFVYNSTDTSRTTPLAAQYYLLLD